MGHIHLGVLPGTRKWKAVVELLASQAPADDVAAASAVAAERDLARATHDPVLVECVRLLALIPQAARAGSFAAELRELGLDVPDRPSLPDLLHATTAAVDRVAQRQARRTDFGELCARALVGTIAARIGGALPSLFGPDTGDVRTAAARMAAPGEFAVAARGLFARLTSETLSSWLDRTLSSHVGPGRRFAHAGERDEFDRALAQYTSEASRIIKEFAGGWYGKTLHRDGTITSERAAAFAAVSFKKIGEELRRKRNADV